MTGDDDPAVVEIAAELYGLDPEAFVAARDRAAKQLRGRGETAAAQAIKALRRPTVAAWAINQLVRAQPQEVDALLDATNALDHAQRTALAGGGADEVRAARERRQRLVDQLARQARAILDHAGRSSAAHEDDVVRTLQASSDPALAEQLRAGRLATALEPVVDLSGLATWYEQSGAMQTAAHDAEARHRADLVTAAEIEVGSAERDLADAEAQVERLQAQLRTAKRRVKKAESTLSRQRRALDDSRRAAE
jgi:hypothetical protein